MHFFLAIFLPFVVMFTLRRPVVEGLFCLLLQLTLIGWIPASIWTLFVVVQHKKRFEPFHQPALSKRHI